MRIAVVGATGEVGRMMIKVLQEKNIFPDNIRFFASKKSKGKTIIFDKKQIIVEELTKQTLKEKFDYILMSAGGAISKIYAPIAARAGSTVIDNSSIFRMDKKIPLVVPEINGDILKNYKGIVANPNCSTIQMVLALYPLAKEFGLKKVVVATYQSVSGSGNIGIQTLKEQREGAHEVGNYPKIIDLNVIPQIGAFSNNGYCEEETKMMVEPSKIMSMPDLVICATTVRVPVIYGHSESVYAEFKQDVNLSKAQKLLSNFPSVIYEGNSYTSTLEIGDSDNSHVSRLRYAGDKKSITFWNVAHNIRTGAATNAVRILQKLLELNA